MEHDPAVPKYYNFRGSTNDGEPRPAAAVGQRMTRIMLAILEAYASDDRRHLDYGRIAASEEFRRCGARPHRQHTPPSHLLRSRTAQSQ